MMRPFYICFSVTKPLLLSESAEFAWEKRLRFSYEIIFFNWARVSSGILKECSAAGNFASDTSCL